LQLQHVGLWREVLAAVATTTHRVTRLDAAMDVERDGAEVLAELRARIHGGCALGRKRVPTRWLLAQRADGQDTGTCYVGQPGRHRVHAKVYDKAQEASDRRGIELGPRTRYEVTVGRHAGATLRD